MAIDVGPGAVNGDTSYPAGYTMIDLNNPANANGKIDTVKVWFKTNATALKVGFFYGVAPNFTCRSVVNIGAVAAGAERTYSGLSLTLKVGDYIGYYEPGGGGQIEFTSSGGTTFWQHMADWTDGVQHTFESNGGYKASLYATGLEEIANPKGNMAQKLVVAGFI